MEPINSRQLVMLYMDVKRTQKLNTSLVASIMRRVIVHGLTGSSRIMATPRLYKKSALSSVGHEVIHINVELELMPSWDWKQFLPSWGSVDFRSHTSTAREQHRSDRPRGGSTQFQVGSAMPDDLRRAVLVLAVASVVLFVKMW